MWPFTRKKKADQSALLMAALQEKRDYGRFIERVMTALGYKFHVATGEACYLQWLDFDWKTWIISEINDLKARNFRLNKRLTALQEEISQEQKKTEAILLKEHERQLGKPQCDCLPGVVCPKCSRQKLGINL